MGKIVNLLFNVSFEDINAQPKIFNKISRQLSTTNKQMQKFIDEFSKPITKE